MSTDPALPVPPWSARRRKPAPAEAKAPLTQEAIVAAALEILDAEGLDGISMRRVAEKLRTGPASLYQHVANKDELLEQLLDDVMAEMKLAEPDPDDWQTPLKQMLREMRAILSSHRDIAYVTMGRIPTGPNALRVAERLLLILRTGGVPQRVASYAVDALALFIGSVSYEESIQGRKMGATLEEAMAYVQQVHDFFASLPADRFPTLVEMAGELTTFEAETDARFEFALEMNVQGVAAMATAALKRSRGGKPKG